MAKPVFRLCLVAGSAALIADVAACSLILDTGADQCNSDTDCTSRGPKFAGNQCVNKVCVGGEGGITDSGASDVFDPMWGCLGKVKAPTFPKPMVNVSVPLIDLVTQKPVTAIDAKVCGKADVSCGMPIGGISQPSAQGILTFTLPAGFDGYVDIHSTNIDGGLPGHIPSLVFFNPPLSDDIIYLTIPLVSPQALSGLAAQFGNKIDMMLGAPFAAINDCTGKPAAGASIAIDKDTDASRTFYFVNGLPTESTTMTDKTGYSGFINIPTGIRNMTGTVADGGALIGRVSVLVRPSTLTYTVLPPTP